jgi:hypothetical protein
MTTRETNYTSISRKDQLAWAASILSREQESQMHGCVIVFFEGGKIVRTKVEKTEKPPVDAVK